MSCLLLVALGVSLAPLAHGQKKKNKKDKQQEQSSAQQSQPQIDTSKLVWPSPPDIARIKWIAQFQGQPPKEGGATPTKKKKQSWMDRLAGVQPEAQRKDIRFILVQPYGVAVDSKGRIYTADTYVGAVFIFDPDTKQVGMIGNGKDARFKAIIGLALDDNDRLFVVDSELHLVSAFDANHKFETFFGADKLTHPSGIAIDKENRFLYVTDVVNNNVMVFDADTYKFLRVIGGPPKKEGDDEPGTFARPTNVAVDGEGNVYVSDTINNRIQIFDADGKFITMFGKAGDRPGYFSRPKGVAVDGDGHIWVVDTDQEVVQVFDRGGRLLAYFGEHGTQPGQFILPTGLAIDKQNRVIVSEQFFHGRLQVFRYVTDAEAAAEKDKAGQAGEKPPTKSALQTPGTPAEVEK